MNQTCHYVKVEATKKVTSTVSLIKTNLGQIGGRSATKCHTGEIKEFRQRCDKVNLGKFR